jgi:hypothetical protein
MRRFQKLLASGLPVTWTTLLVGRQEGHINTEEVQAYAGDQLACCSDADAYQIFRLYDADPTNIWEVNHWLQELAGEAEAARETAHRIWDLALLKPLLVEMPDTSASNEEMLEALYALTDFWAERGYPPHSPHTVQGHGNDISPGIYYTVDTYRRILEAHREWAGREETALRQKPMG